MYCLINCEFCLVHDFQNVTVSFYNNSARLSGAAVYASDMQLCSWLGPELTTVTGQSIIFNYPDNLTVTPPFQYRCVHYDTAFVYIAIPL